MNPRAFICSQLYEVQLRTHGTGNIIIRDSMKLTTAAKIESCIYLGLFLPNQRLTRGLHDHLKEDAP